MLTREKKKVCRFGFFVCSTEEGISETCVACDTLMSERSMAARYTKVYIVLVFWYFGGGLGDTRK